MVKTPANVDLPGLNQKQAAALVGRDPTWIRKHVKTPGKGNLYDPAVVVECFANEIISGYEVRLAARVLTSDSDSGEISRRKKIAEAQRAERELRLADLRIARLEAKLMPVDWVHRMLEEMASELRKPIAIIGRNHPEYEQMIINALDNAMDKLATMLSDDQTIG